MHVNVLIPTRNRWELLRRTLESVAQSTYKNTSIHLVVDADYGVIPEWLSKYEIDFIVDSGSNNLVTQIGNAISKLNIGAVLGSGDDSIFRPNCIELVVNAMQQHFPNSMGVVGLNQHIDGKPFGNKGVYSMLNRQFLDHFPNGNPFCPDYVHFGVDKEITDYAMYAGVFYSCEEAIVEHIRPDDDTTRRGNVHIWTDAGIYTERQKKGYLWGKNFDLLFQ